MSVNEGDLAPEISGMDLVTNTPWSLKAQADAHVLLAFTAITGSSPFDQEASALGAVWNTLNGNTDSPFKMAIIAGYKGPGSPPPQETQQELKAAIQKFQITCPVVLAPQSWITYLLPNRKAPALYCLHWEAGAYTVPKMGGILSGIKPGGTDKITQDILDFLDGCGVHKAGIPRPDPFANLGGLLTLPVILMFIGGVLSDGGGWGIPFGGGRPIPVPPWDPLRFLGSAGRDALVGLAVAGIAGQIGNPDLRNQVWQAGIRAAKSSLDHLDEGSAGPASFGFTLEGAHI